MADYVNRVLADDEHGETVESDEVPEEFPSLLWADCLFDNSMASLTGPPLLKALAAISTPTPSDAAVSTNEKRLKASAAELPRWLRELTEPRLERLSRLDAAKQEFEETQSDASLSSALAQHRTDAIQLTFSELRFDTIDVANEAYLCAIIDGTPFGELAELSGSTCTVRSLFAGDLQRDMQTALVSARPGEIVKVYDEASADYRLLTLDVKDDPDLTSDHVRSRLTDRLLSNTLHTQYGTHVRWHIPITTT
jgi:hypothetical protein